MIRVTCLVHAFLVIPSITLSLLGCCSDAQAITRQQINKNVEKYGIVKTNPTFNMNEVLIFNDTKQRNENLALYLADQKMTLLFIWRNSCDDCVGKVKYMDAMKSFQQNRNLTRLNLIPIANFYDDQRSIRRKFLKKDIENTDLLFIKDINVFKELVGEKQFAYFLIDQDGNLFARIDKANIRDGGFAWFLRELQKRVSR